MTATFEDVILQSQPAFYRDGAVGAGTAGVTWRWLLESPEGADADWSDVVFVCEILSQTDDDLVLLELEMTSDEANRITIGASAATTIALDEPTIQTYPWRAYATRVDDVVAMWNAAASTFTVYPAGYVEGS